MAPVDHCIRASVNWEAQLFSTAMVCKDCVSGTLHEGTPAGREETVHGRATYITEPPNGAAAKGIVVILPDVFGWKLLNTRILADNYAERCQVTVYVPDFMDGMCMFKTFSSRYC